MTLAIGELAIACGVVALLPSAAARDTLASVTPPTRPPQQGCGTHA